MYGVFFGVTILISTVETGCAPDAAGFHGWSYLPPANHWAVRECVHQSNFGA